MPSDSVMGRVDPPDGGWGWVVVAAVFLTAFLTFGSLNSYPLFYTPLMQEFNAGLGDVTWLTACSELGRIFGFLTTAFLIAKTGFRVTCICVSFAYGICVCLASLSNSLFMVCALAGLASGVAVSVCCTTYAALIPRYFNDKRVLAIALSICGTPAGSLALAPLTQYFINIYGWRGAMLLLGGLNLNSVVAASLYRPILLNTDPTEPENISFNNWQSALKPLKEVLVLPKFWIYSTLWLNLLCALYLYTRFLVPYSLSLDIELMAASLLLSAYSGVNLFARVAFGVLGNRKNVNILWLLFITQSLVVFITASMWFVDNYLGLLLNCIAHSLIGGGMNGLYPQVLAIILNDKNLTWGNNASGLFFSVVGTWVTPLVGWLVDRVGDIRFAFIVASIFQMFGMFLHIPLFTK